jgi:uncharacterized protein
MFWFMIFLGVVATMGTAFFLLVLADRMTTSKRRRVQGAPADLDLRYEEIQFLTVDRFTLRGWFLECPAARGTVVVVHDCGTTRGDADRRLLHLQRDYVRRGYSVFAFDLRGHGESAGKRDPLGCTESLDVQAAVTYVRRRTPRAPVVLHGFGFGAALSLTAVANGAEVAAVIADSSFMTMRSYLRRRWQHMPRQLFSVSAFLARRLFRADIDALQPIKAVPRVAAPVLFIHNENDPEVPMMDTLNLAAGSLDERDRLWIIPNTGGHATGYRQAPDLYLRHCLEFLDEVIPARVLVAQAV